MAIRHHLRRRVRRRRVARTRRGAFRQRRSVRRRVPTRRNARTWDLLLVGRRHAPWRLEARRHERMWRARRSGSRAAGRRIRGRRVCRRCHRLQSSGSAGEPETAVQARRIEGRNVARGRSPLTRRGHRSTRRKRNVHWKQITPPQWREPSNSNLRRNSHGMPSNLGDGSTWDLEELVLDETSAIAPPQRTVPSLHANTNDCRMDLASLFPAVRAKAWTCNRKDVQVSRARRIDAASGICSWTCLARICQDVFGSRATRVSEAVLFFPPSNWRHPSSLGRARNSAGRSVRLRSRTNRAMRARGLIVAIPLVSSPRGQGSSFLCRRVFRRFVSRLQVSCSSFPQHTGQVTVPCPWHVLHFAMPTLFGTPAPPGRVCTSPTPSQRLQMSNPHPFLQLGHALGRATTRLSKYAGRLGARLSPIFSCAQACHRGAHPRPTMPSTCVSLRHTDPFFSFSNLDRPGSVPGSNPNLSFLPLPFPRESKPNRSPSPSPPPRFVCESEREGV